MAYKVEKDWTTKAGLRACAIFVEGMHRCGYVAVDKKNPFYGKNIDDTVPFIKTIDDIPRQEVGKRGVMSLLPVYCGSNDKAPRLDLIFDVHGSLTFGNKNPKEDYPVESPGMHWLGFDCGHSGDRSAYSLGYGEERTLDYVIGECESLAEQIVEYSKLAEKKHGKRKTTKTSHKQKRKASRPARKKVLKAKR